MKLLMILIGVVLMLAGLALAGAGVLWSGPDAAMTGPFSAEPLVRGNIVPAVAPFVEGLLPLIPHEAREFLFFPQYGLLPLFGVAGLLVFLSGGLMLRNLPKASSRAVVRKNKEQVKSEVLKREAEKKKAQAEGAPVAAAGGVYRQYHRYTWGAAFEGASFIQCQQGGADYADQGAGQGIGACGSC